MRQLRSRTLLDAPLVHVADVTCRAPRCGPGAEEGGERLELVLPRRGVFAVHRGRERNVADANSVVLMGGGEHRVSHPAAGGDDCTALHFAPELLEEALGPKTATRHAVVSPRAQLLRTALNRGPDALAGEETAMALLAELAPALTRAPLPTPRANRARADDVRALLAAHPSRAWRLEDVARAVHASPFHLARQFRAATGETIARYLVRLRLAAALERLAAGESALARLAVELGFAHHSHFSARFRAAFGVTPSQARKIVTVGSRVAP